MCAFSAVAELVVSRSYVVVVVTILRCDTVPSLFIFRHIIFTALHEMQMRSNNENSVCPFVRLSVCLSNVCIKKKDLSRLLYHTKDHLGLAYFSEKKNIWWEGTPT